jgi:4-hydroxy-tetrahydrodipicolinate synthase
MAEYSARAGAAAVVSAPPFYFQYDQSDLLHAVETLARNSPIPLYLYNMPGLVKTSFDVETVAHAAQIENIRGFKDSSGDLRYLAKVLEAVSDRPEFSIFVGPEHLLCDALLLGAHGGVPGGANLFPHLPVRLYEAFLKGKIEEMRSIQQEMDRVGAPIWNGYGSAPRHLIRLKAALAATGLCSPIPAWPYQTASPEEVKQIVAHLEASGLLAKS